MDDDVRKLRRDLLARVLGDHLEGLTDRLIDALLAQVPAYGELDREELRQQAHLQVACVRLYFAGESDRALREGPSAYGVQRALDGVPLDAVLHAYRVAWAELWTGVTEIALDEGTASATDLVRASGEFFWMADLFASTAARSYEQISGERRLDREREKAATVEALLLGQVAPGHPLDQAARLLGAPLDGLFVVVVGRPRGIGQAALPGVRGELSRRGLVSAWRLSREREAGIVHVADDEALGTVRTALERHGARAGISPVVTGLGAVADALPLATLAERMVVGDQGVRIFSSSPVARVLAAAPDQANALVRTVLAEVRALPEAEASLLLSTLQVWFDVKGSTSAAAARLFCHANTVRYRLRRLEQLTGRSLHDPDDAAELRIALLAYDQIPLADSAG